MRQDGQMLDESLPWFVEIPWRNVHNKKQEFQIPASDAHNSKRLI